MKTVTLALLALLAVSCSSPAVASTPTVAPTSAAAAAIDRAKSNAFAACEILVERQLPNESAVRVGEADIWEDEDIVQLGGNFKVSMRYPRQGYFLCSVNRVSDDGDWELNSLDYLGFSAP
jgi:hypothetical protein